MFEKHLESFVTVISTIVQTYIYTVSLIRPNKFSVPIYAEKFSCLSCKLSYNFCNVIIDNIFGFPLTIKPCQNIKINQPSVFPLNLKWTWIVLKFHPWTVADYKLFWKVIRKCFKTCQPWEAFTSQIKKCQKSADFLAGFFFFW